MKLLVMISSQRNFKMHPPDIGEMEDHIITERLNYFKHTFLIRDPIHLLASIRRMKAANKDLGYLDNTRMFNLEKIFKVRIHWIE